jgi:UDP-3-O-[3-hydroxymyristoyl] glucosamine N-acyltransferase
MELTLAELARRLGAELRGDGTIRVHGVAGIREAGPGQVTFLANPRYEEFLVATRASAVIVPPGTGSMAAAALVTPEPYLAFVDALEIFDPGVEETVLPGIHPTALIDPTAEVDPTAGIGPFVVVGAGAWVGPRSVLMAGAYLGPSARLGADCVLYPRVTVRKECEIGDRVVIHSGAVIGDDGFGFAPVGDAYRKIPQVGRVVIGDDCEIGANATIDRATTGVTRIGRGCRIDNLVMIAHGVEVGENTIICAQTGISGSTRVGKHVVLAGQVGVIGHITIGDGARLGAQAGVTKSVPAGESWSGYPARPHVRASRSYAGLRDLPGALKRLRELERRLRALEERAGDREGKEPGEGSRPA